MINQVLKYQVVVFLLILLSINGFAQHVVINEVMYDNKNVLFDADNDTPDWIELYNTGDEAINLEGYQLTDDTTEIEHWTFHDFELAPKSFLIVFASGKNRKEGELHTYFKLGLMKDPVALISPTGELLSHYDIQCVPQDLSLGYAFDGVGELMVQKPSPGKSNEESEKITINYQPDELTFSEKSGFYKNEFELLISNKYPQNEIKFTTNSETPEFESATYSKPILIKDRTPNENIYANIRTAEFWQKPGNNIFKGTPVRAIVYSEGCPASKEITNTYFVHPKIENKYKVPVVSLVTDSDNLFDKDKGIYVDGNHQNSQQHGKEWEREAHIEIWESPENEIIKQDIGIRIHGRGSRSAPKKTLRLYAREKYGTPYFEYPFFDDKPNIDQFKTLLLRTSVDETGTLFVDELCHNLVSDMDIDYQSGKTMVVFINGEYWGLHSLRERQDEEYIKNNYNTESEDYDIISHEPTRGPELAEGTMDAYTEMINFLENNDLTDDYNYEQACKMVDVSNIMDYYIAQLYLANWDFPNNNVKFWRENAHNSLWRTFFFDCDMCMMRINYDHLTEYLTEYENQKRYEDWSTVVLRSFLKNKAFRDKFALRYYKYMNSAFRPDVVIEKINEFEAMYEPLIAEHTYRWHDPVDIIKWRENVDMLRQFALQRPVVMNEQLENLIENPFTVFPNPTKSGFYISNSIDEDVDIETQIYSIDGRMIYVGNQKLSANSENYLEPGLLNGFYLVKIKYGDFSFVSKLVKY